TLRTEPDTPHLPWRGSRLTSGCGRSRIRSPSRRAMQVERDTSDIEGTVTAGFAMGVIAYGRARGLDPAPLFAAVGLDADALREPELRIPVGVSFTIIAHVARTLDDPALPVRLSEHRRIEDLHLVGFLVMTSATSREAFERVIAYSALLSDSSRWVMD